MWLANGPASAKHSRSTPSYWFRTTDRPGLVISGQSLGHSRHHGRCRRCSVDAVAHVMGQIAPALTVGGLAMTERDSSPAYQAFSPSGRTVLALIERQIERSGGVAVLSFSDIEVLLRHHPRHLRLRPAAGQVAWLRGRRACVGPLPPCQQLQALADQLADNRTRTRRTDWRCRHACRNRVRCGCRSRALRSSSRRWRTSRLATGDDRLTERSQFMMASGRTGRLTPARSSLASRRHR